MAHDDTAAQIISCEASIIWLTTTQLHRSSLVRPRSYGSRVPFVICMSFSFRSECKVTLLERARHFQRPISRASQNTFCPTGAVGCA